MKFEYKAIGSKRRRPFIPVTLRNPKTKEVVECWALVDSGADCNLFASVLGEIIGLDIESGIQRPVAGIVAGEKRSYFEHELELIVGGWTFHAKVGFMPSISSQAGEGIVGQSGFFNNFKYVKFDKNNEFVELGNFVGEA